MQRITLSLAEDHAALLDDAADEWDVSRSEAARRVFSAYEERMNSSYELPDEDTESSHDVHTEFTRRLDELDERVDDLEAARLETTSDEPELDDLIEAGEEADRSGAAQPAPQRDEPTADREAGADDSRSAAHSADARDDALAAADEWQWTDEPRGDPEEYRETFRAVVRALDERGPMGKSDLLEAVYPDHAAGFEKRNNWWKNLALEFLQDLRDEHGLAHTTGGGRWTKWQLGRDPDE